MMVYKNLQLAAIAASLIFLIKLPNSRAASIQHRADYETVEGYGFYAQFLPVTREEAVSTCESLGMKLASITTHKKWKSVKLWLLLNGFYWGFFWTSGVKEPGTSLWIWEVTKEVVAEFQWASSQPNLGDSETERHCIGFTVELGGWYEYECEVERLSFFCERYD